MDTVTPSELENGMGARFDSDDFALPGEPLEDVPAKQGEQDGQEEVAPIEPPDETGNPVGEAKPASGETKPTEVRVEVIRDESQLDLMKEIIGAESDCSLCEARVAGIKRELKDANESLDDAILNLRELVKWMGSDLRDRPLLDIAEKKQAEEKKEEAKPETNTVNKDGTLTLPFSGDPVPAEEEKPATAPAADAINWTQFTGIRDVLLMDLKNPKIPPGTLKSLSAAKMEMVSDVIKHIVSGKQLTDIQGIAKGKAAKIDAALHAEWERQKGK